MDFKIDYAFPMVNPFDKIWQKEYAKYFDDDPVYNVRHRKSPKLLRYMLRSLAKNMPWIDNLFMVVACPTQVPSWVNKKTVNVVLHKDIIPSDELPTFNTCTIDKYVNSIPGLSEHYVYGYDDFYAVKPIEAEQFFSKDGMPIRNSRAFHVRKFDTEPKMRAACKENRWYSLCRKTYEIAKASYGEDFFKEFPVKIQEPFLLLHGHMFMPQTKSIVSDVMSKCKVGDMMFAKGRDFDQVLTCSLTLMYLSCKGAPGNAPTNAKLPTYDEKIDNAMAEMTQSKFCESVEKYFQGAQCICINNNDDTTRPLYAGWLESKFPDKCKYEI